MQLLNKPNQTNSPEEIFQNINDIIEHLDKMPLRSGNPYIVKLSNDKFDKRLGVIEANRSV